MRWVCVQEGPVIRQCPIWLFWLPRQAYTVCILRCQQQEALWRFSRLRGDHWYSSSLHKGVTLDTLSRKQSICLWQVLAVSVAEPSLHLGSSS